MKESINHGLFAIVMSLIIVLPSIVAAEPAKDVEAGCGTIQELDDKNLCRAFEIEKTRTDEQRKNRYQNKDHSTYYCSIIKNRDKQTFCFAVVGRNKTQCGLIIDANLEKECNSKLN